MTWLQLHWLKVLAITLLCGALTSVPYMAYYQLMNWVVLAAAIVTAMQAHHTERDTFMWLSLLVAIVFNPIAPLYFSTSVWHIADGIAIFFFVLATLTIRAAKK